MGLGGTVKRLAAQASLQRLYDDQIMTPHQLFLFAQKNIPSIKFHFDTTEENDQEVALFLASSFQCTLDNVQFISGIVAGTHNFHYIHLSNESVKVRVFV